MAPKLGWSFASDSTVVFGRGYGLWIFTCPVSHDHPHQMSMQ